MLFLIKSCVQEEKSQGASNLPRQRRRCSCLRLWGRFLLRRLCLMKNMAAYMQA